MNNYTKRNYENYKTVAVLGSFRKHYEAVKEDVINFASEGFTVLAPTISKIKSEDNGYIIFESDSSNNPKKIEKKFLKKCLDADVIYVSNIDGYLGKTVMFELGYLLAFEKEIYFRETPKEEQLIITMCMEAKDSVISSKKLCSNMSIHNQVLSMRSWHDSDQNRNHSISI